MLSGLAEPAKVVFQSTRKTSLLKFRMQWRRYGNTVQDVVVASEYNNNAVWAGKAVLIKVGWLQKNRLVTEGPISVQSTKSRSGLYKIFVEQ